MILNKKTLLSFFDRQVQILLQNEYPNIAKMSKTKFLQLVDPIKNVVCDLKVNEVDIINGYLPFILVVKNDIVPTEYAITKIEKDGKRGLEKLFPLLPNDFKVINTINIPHENVYVLVDIDRGKKYLNVSPHNAMKQIIQSQRSPLTIDEGVAVVTQYPEFLMKNNCFSLLASRHTGDKRVPAVWINGNNQPNLGWCWENNPHKWLGSISAKLRTSGK